MQPVYMGFDGTLIRLDSIVAVQFAEDEKSAVVFTTIGPLEVEIESRADFNRRFEELLALAVNG